MDLPDKCRICALDMTLSQENDSDDDGDLGQTIKISIIDVGGGAYAVLSTERWAIDGDDIDKLARQLKDLIGKVPDYD